MLFLDIRILHTQKSYFIKPALFIKERLQTILVLTYPTWYNSADQWQQFS